MERHDTSQVLRTALRANALFSTLCGLLLLVAATPLSPWLGVPSLALRVVGASLLPFAFGLWRNAARPAPSRVEAWVACGLDLVWVLASAELLVFKLWPFTPAGSAAVLIVASAVLSFALMQVLGLRRMSELAEPPS